MSSIIQLKTLRNSRYVCLSDFENSFNEYFKQSFAQKFISETSKRKGLQIISRNNKTTRNLDALISPLILKKEKYFFKINYKIENQDLILTSEQQFFLEKLKRQVHLFSKEELANLLIEVQTQSFKYQTAYLSEVKRQHGMEIINES